jgi:hypothetical protein
LERLKKVGAIKSHKKEYTLTAIAKEILQHVHVIEEIEQKNKLRIL